MDDLIQDCNYERCLRIGYDGNAVHVRPSLAHETSEEAIQRLLKIIGGWHQKQVAGLQARIAELEAELAARPSPEYVELLEEYAIDPGWEFLRSVCGWECAQRWRGDDAVGLCTHENPPVGCLKAAEREKEAKDCG